MSDITSVQNKILKKIEKMETSFQRNMVIFYRRKTSDIEKEIAAFFLMYSENDKIAYRNAMLQPTNGELASLSDRVHRFSLTHPDRVSLLPDVSGVSLNRLDVLRASLRMHLMEMAEYETMAVNGHLQSVFSMTYKETAKALDIEPDMVEMTAEKLDVADTVSKNCDKLANYIEQDIAQDIVRGFGYEKTAEEICERIERVSKNDIDRLTYTEDTAAFNEASSEVFVGAGYEQYRFISQRDEDVCSVCRDLDSQVFDLVDRRVGINFPPIHPWCRCRVEPVEWKEV